MQPKTKTQKRVVELYNTLKPLTPKQEEWGKYNKPTKAFFDKNGNICAYCGESMGESLICPVCGRKHTGVANDNRKYYHYHNFNILIAVKEFQVIRTYEVKSTFQRKKSAVIEYAEICQSWVDAKGIETRVSRTKTIGLFGNGYSWWTPMEIRANKNKSYYSYYDDLHRWSQNAEVYPYSRSFSPSVKRNGLQNCKIVSKSNMHPFDFITKILTDSKSETLLKTGYGHLIGADGIDRYWQQVKIAIRHHYKLTDWTIWKDTLDMLQEEGKDICNPHYICPVNLMEVHDKLLARKNARDLREKELKNKDAQVRYAKAKSKYFGFVVTDKELSIEVIKSVAEMILEGERMNHCVGKLKYYEKANSLILSAKVNGKSMETIEVDLRNFAIVQSRGKCNQNSPYHDRIVDLMRGNMEQIRKIKQKANKAQKVA